MNEPSRLMISVEDALARITQAMTPVASETVGLETVVGRFLSEDVISRRTQPPFDISAMDGYALRSEDAKIAPFTLRQIGEVPAGSAFKDSVKPGTCVRIFTGGRVPDTADTVIMQEQTAVSGDEVTFSEAKEAGNNIRSAGGDFMEGDIGLSAGHRVTAQDASLLAAMNVPWVSVHRKPRIALLATGDELVRPGEPVGENQILSSNTYGIGAMIRQWGGEPVDLGIAQDNTSHLRACLEGAKGCDVLVTLGGASVGDHDLVQKVLTEDGLDLDFWKIAMKPGKPLIFGNWAGLPLVGVPGNPVSALVCALLYLKPALYALQGDKDPREANKTVPVILGQDLPKNGPRQDFMRARLERVDGQLRAFPFESQDSAKLSVLSAAGCLVIRTPNHEASKAGDTASAILISDI
jgi:molybdopterin molybdotransferase